MKPPTFKSNRFRVLGIDAQKLIRWFFASNAAVAIVVLTLIMINLFKEGYRFAPENQEELTLYRESGQEAVDGLKDAAKRHGDLAKQLTDLRLDQLKYLEKEKGLEFEAANEQTQELFRFWSTFRKSAKGLTSYTRKLVKQTQGIKDRAVIAGHREDEKAMLESRGMHDAAAEVVVEGIPFEENARELKVKFNELEPVLADFEKEMGILLADVPAVQDPKTERDREAFIDDARAFVATLPDVRSKLDTWKWDEPVPGGKGLKDFLFGKHWTTNSAWHDFFGAVPLFIGSLLISAVALLIAVPFGVGSAIYVNRIAGIRQQNIIKPLIEFIGAIPSVVLGFFGIVVLGEGLRAMSHFEWLAWMPGFPMSERLTIFTAGCLLAFMSIPTIFSLSEDALNNVPKSFTEASAAMGATQFQTITRIVVPASLSGIVAAILLGFGRVIGETMVVLLVAGNMIKIPDFSQGLGVIFQPSHTMTGIIAQEMGEVVPGSIHYRALFMVGIVLFLISLVINFLAQKIVRRYKISVG